ncbi:uncharacterized protein PV06_01321 [Exophiala oligosperma]|uniref:Norsolorinic acid ketoreductase n=1 Tax=Exophiala oligosperma TaxID=215243 RepID=A0A0D2E1T7_9EURO|nr:uncharacterized protein PV06_01321 [Exophiala oligosperma]KIW48755.1 hypothetical protein PV06_01321 [Exophiala oligosperma]
MATTATTKTTYLITGGNRGIGKGLVAAYLSRPNNTVIAGVRDLQHPTSVSLQSLPKDPSSSLIVVKIDSLSETDALDAVAKLESKHDVDNLDVVVANAGISAIWPAVAEAKPSDMIDHYRVNAVGITLLFQAVLPLLKKSSSNKNITPKFVTLGTIAGSIAAQETVPVPNAAYGPSKAAMNWITKKIHLEHPYLIAFPLSPGFVDTDMGKAGAKFFGMGPEVLITLDESINGMTKVIDSATRETASGKNLTYEGKEDPY